MFPIFLLLWFVCGQIWRALNVYVPFSFSFPFYLSVNFKNNGFAEMLYGTKWEVFPPKIQKIIMLLIHRKQSERGLKLGPFGVGINRESFKLVIAFFLNLFKLYQYKICLEKVLVSIISYSHEHNCYLRSIFFQSTNKIYTFIMFLVNFFN